MAETIFNALVEDTGLPFRAQSAGTHARKGKRMDAGARAALDEVGVYAESHRTRQVNEAMLEEADLILAMSPQHVAELQRSFDGFSHKIHTLTEYTRGATGEREIPDPYGYTMAAYRASTRQLFDYLSLLITSLKEERSV